MRKGPHSTQNEEEAQESQPVDNEESIQMSQKTAAIQREEGKWILTTPDETRKENRRQETEMGQKRETESEEVEIPPGISPQEKGSFQQKEPYLPHM